MDKLLTIVIPTYNMQDYLRKCLDSLIVDESKMPLLEVLVINDGSKDSSSEIAHEYESRFPGIFRVIDKENGNYGSCVNRGLAEATGKYIKILDADDYFDTNAFSLYLDAMTSLDVDMIFTNHHSVDPKGGLIEKFEIPAFAGIFDFRQYNNVAMLQMHSITYRTAMLRSIDYKQTEGISHTDVEWSILPTTAIKSAAYIPNDIYSYLLGRDGQTMDPKVFSKSAGAHLAIATRVLQVYQNIPNTYDFQYIRQRFCSVIEHLSRVMYKLFLLELPSNSFYPQVLKEYDSHLWAQCPDVFYSLEKSMVPKGIPFHYVRFWHKTGLRFPLGLARDIVRKVRYGG